MKKLLFVSFAVAVTSIFTVNAQTNPIFIVGFEELNNSLDSGEVLNGSDGNTKYVLTKMNNGFEFSLDLGWDTSFGGYWGNNFAISRKNYTTIEKSDFSKHIYCAKPGYGSENAKSGNIYAVGHMNSTILQKEPKQYLLGFNVSNTTYAFNSMALGDDFGRKFSSENQDSFILVISAYKFGILTQNIRLVLADFRGNDPNKHFILDTWQRVQFDYYPDSVQFTMLSSDNGQWGMNTPGFFAIDEITIGQSISTQKIAKNALKIYPNPANSNFILPEMAMDGKLAIFDIAGKEVLEIQKVNTLNVDVSDLKTGIYFVELMDKHQQKFTTRLIKNN